MNDWILIVAAALLGSTIAAIAGTGGGIILLPVLVSVFGIREAVPLYAVVQLVGNLSRVGLNWPQVRMRVVAWFCAGAIPFALFGAWLFTRLPENGLVRLLGAFLILSVAWRHWRGDKMIGFNVRWFAPVGALFALVSAIVGSAGPFLTPFYLAYGLVKGAFIGTEALGTAAMHVAKLLSYQGLGAISGDAWLHGLLLGPVMIAGSWMGKRVLDRLPARYFILIVETAILGFGFWFLLQ